MALIYRWHAPFEDGWNAQLNGLELVCGNTFGHHVDMRNWRVPPRVRALRGGRSWHWLDMSRRVITMIVPDGNSRSFRYEWHVDDTPSTTPTSDDPSLVAANEFVADGVGSWASYYDVARRVVANGQIIVPTGAGGVKAAAGELSTVLFHTRIAVYDIRTGAKTREFVPHGTYNEHTLDDGWIGHGYSGDAHVISREGARWQVNVYEGSKEGVPRVKTGPEGRKWAFTSIDFANATSAILARPVGETKSIIVPGGFAHFTVSYDDTGRRFVFAGNGQTSPGALTIMVVDADAERQDVGPLVAPLGRPAFFGGFYATTDRYPETIADYPQTCEVIVEPDAVQRSRVKVIVSREAIHGVHNSANVLGLYVAEELTATGASLDAEAELARAEWRRVFPDRPVPPTVGYLTRGMVDRPGWPPKKIDVYGPEMYDAYTREAITSLFEWWLERLPADRAWMLICQAYDRNIPDLEKMKTLASVSDAFLDPLRPQERGFVAGLLMFAVNRIGTRDGKTIGGVVVYPELLSVHRRMFAAIPSAPASLPHASEEPGGDMIKVHVGDFTDKCQVGDVAYVDFRVESDSPVTEIRIDRRRDGLPGLVLKPGAELPDLRDLRGVKVIMTKAGSFSWHVGAKNAAGEPDESGQERTIEVTA
jgi:hypothetical protein